MDIVPRYNKQCRNETCGGGGWGRRYRREDDVVCQKCYRRLPALLRKGLWVKDGEPLTDWHGRVVLALTWLDENPE